MSLSSLSLCMVRMMSWVKLCVEKRDVINMKWEDIHGRMEKDDTTCDGCKHVSASSYVLAREIGETGEGNPKACSRSDVFCDSYHIQTPNKYGCGTTEGP